jgi:hypothetical protein
MTIWINAGAAHSTGERIKTKAELKRVLKATPQAVTFDTTSNFPNAEETVVASDLGNRPRAAEEAWQICGPDPYADRKWYATVRANRLGNLKVS